MAQNLCPDRPRATIAVLSLILPRLRRGMGADRRDRARRSRWFLVCRQEADVAVGRPPKRRSAGAWGSCSPASMLRCSRCRLLRLGASAAALAAAFYRSGALVFGGGHVVLPLLRAAVVDPGWVSDSAFLAGYGAAQAVPGPLFTFAAYLGAVASVPPSGIAGAALALVAIFAPGLLLADGGLGLLAATCERAATRAPRWPASTRPWSVCSLRRSITRYGRARSGVRPISPLRRRALSP